MDPVEPAGNSLGSAAADGLLVSAQRKRLLRTEIERVAIDLLLMGAVLFGTAGRINWPAAWVLIAMYFLYLAGTTLWGMKKAPALVAERSRAAPNVKKWDKVILTLSGILQVALIVTAGLDAGRFRWSSMPATLQALGALGVLAGAGVIWWCMSANAFLSSFARIQTDRGQTVVQRGPYRYVRHPMYAAGIILMTCVALLLGSWWALIPATLLGALLVLRTAKEDRMLTTELPGYREYATEVRYRLLPAAW